MWAPKRLEATEALDIWLEQYQQSGSPNQRRSPALFGIMTKGGENSLMRIRTLTFFPKSQWKLLYALLASVRPLTMPPPGATSTRHPRRCWHSAHRRESHNNRCFFLSWCSGARRIYRNPCTSILDWMHRWISWCPLSCSFGVWKTHYIQLIWTLYL